MIDFMTYLIFVQLMVLLLLLPINHLHNKRSYLKFCFSISSVFIVSATFITALLAANIFDIMLLATYGVWLVTFGRMFIKSRSVDYIINSSLRDAYLFNLICIFLLFGSYFSQLGELNLINQDQLITLISQVLFGISLIFLGSVIVSVKKYRYKDDHSEPDKLPTVTLAIPARNETRVLKAALDAALSSNYEKLEILVLDDCSQDQTAKIIKSYAHKGVRFVQGSEPTSSWIGKNQAYSVLLEEASGDYVIFCGVDVRISVGTISRLVNYATSHDLKMLSVLPQRLNLDIYAHIIQPMRYFWQLALPRFAGNYPPVISSSWMINRQTANKLGGFKAMKHSMIPESYFARKLNRTEDYKFLLSTATLGITTRKRPQSQVDTAIRTHYPLTKRSFALSWLIALSIFCVFLVPFTALLLEVLGRTTNYLWLPAVSYLIVNLIIMTFVAPIAWFVGLISFPIAMLVEAALFMISAWQYEFGQIEWKGRNICVPVMKPKPSSKLYN